MSSKANTTIRRGASGDLRNGSLATLWQKIASIMTLLPRAVTVKIRASTFPQWEPGHVSCCPAVSYRVVAVSGDDANRFRGTLRNLSPASGHGRSCCSEDTRSRAHRPRAYAGSDRYY